MIGYLSTLSDVLLLAAAAAAGLYCLILSRRLTRLTSIDKGLGGAIAVLSAQVDDMTKALAQARSGSDQAADRLTKLMRDAEDLSGDLEMVLAACHDLDGEAPLPADLLPEAAARRPEAPPEPDLVDPAPQGEPPQSDPSAETVPDAEAGPHADLGATDPAPSAPRAQDPEPPVPPAPPTAGAADADTAALGADRGSSDPSPTFGTRRRLASASADTETPSAEAAVPVFRRGARAAHAA